MRISAYLLAPTAALALALWPAAQGVGSQLGPVNLSDLAQTQADSYDDFVGRTVLLEFFAHW